MRKNIKAHRLRKPFKRKSGGAKHMLHGGSKCSKFTEAPSDFFAKTIAGIFANLGRRGA